MRLSDYPPQEPFTEIGARYHQEAMRRGADVVGAEHIYGADPYQSLVVVRSQVPTGDVLIALHGGGWTNGYKEWMLFMAPALTALGVTFVSIGYRLAPQHLFPACVEDVLDGIAVVHRDANHWGGNPARIFVMGHSAGGHLAALAAVRDDWQAQRGLPRDVIRGAMPISGTYYFGEGSGLSMRPRFLGAPDAQTDRLASPMSFVRAGLPPFLLAHGDSDFPHLIRQAREFEAALLAVRNSVHRVQLTDCNHLKASYLSADANGPWISAALNLMRSV
jgi:acetyl esterase/lipase